MFSQAVLPLLEASTSLPRPPTLIFTGASAGVKAFPNSAAFAAGSFAKRGLSQSLAKEFGPKGVHVVYAVIDGMIDVPWASGLLNEIPDAKISPAAVSLVDACVLELWVCACTDGCIDCGCVLAYPYAAKDCVYVGD